MSVVQDGLYQPVVWRLDCGRITAANGVGRVSSRATWQLNCLTVPPLRCMDTQATCVHPDPFLVNPRSTPIRTTPASTSWGSSVSRQVPARLAIRSLRAAMSTSQVPGATTFPDNPTGLEDKFNAAVEARVVAVVGAGAISPYSGASWEEVMRQMVRIKVPRTTQVISYQHCSYCLHAAHVVRPKERATRYHLSTTQSDSPLLK